MNEPPDYAALAFVSIFGFIGFASGIGLITTGIILSKGIMIGVGISILAIMVGLTAGLFAS